MFMSEASFILVSEFVSPFVALLRIAGVQRSLSKDTVGPQSQLGAGILMFIASKFFHQQISMRPILVLLLSSDNEFRYECAKTPSKYYSCLSDISKHIVLYTPLHSYGLSIFQFHARLTTVSCQSCHLQLELFI